MMKQEAEVHDVKHWHFDAGDPPPELQTQEPAR